MSKTAVVDQNGNPYNRLLLVITLLIGTFCTFLNQTILTTAFPTLMRDFNISASTVQWLTSGFMMVMGIMIPVSAWLLAKFNVKYLYISALTLFLLGTIMCRFAPSFGFLLLGRLIQAAGVGMSAPTFQTVMYSVFPPEKRGSAMGLAGIVIGLAPAIGPTLSGWVLLHHGWRTLFSILIPIAVAVIILASYSLRKVLPTSNPKIDGVSVLESTVGFGSLLYGFSTAGQDGWSDTKVLISLILGLVVVALFVRRQLNMSKPLLDLRVFASKGFTASVILTAVAFVSMTGVEMVLPLYIQTVRGESAFYSGLMLFPGAIMMGIMSPITGRVFDRIGARRLAQTGMFLLVAGTLPLMSLTTTTPLIFITGLYTIRMFGITMVLMPVTTSGMNSLPATLISHGTAVNNTARQISAAIGTAILISVLSSVTQSVQPSHHVRMLDPLVYGARLQQALIAGYRSAFALSVLFALVGWALTFTLRDRDDERGDRL